jgi:hypothetical protein
MDTYKPIFTAVLLIIVKLQKQPRCLTTDEWIKKIWYLYAEEYYQATKKNEILLLSDKWMKLENIMLSEASQVQKDRLHVKYKHYHIYI